MFAKYADDIQSLPLKGKEIDKTKALDGRLLIESEGDIEMHYAPFDHVTEGARIVLMGITPGWKQMEISLRVARERLNDKTRDHDHASILKEVKGEASFAGAIRSNLIAMLDYFRIHELLGIPGCADLFGSSRDLVHYTSAFRYPVFRKGVNYSGQSPVMTKPPLARYPLDYCSAELEALPGAYIVPMGEKVTGAIEYIAEHRDIGQNRILSGLQHPSGANNERVAYLIERKSREDVSTQVNTERIDRDRAALKAKVTALLDKSSASR